MLKTIRIKDLLAGHIANDQPVEINAWVRTKRGSANVVFIALNDGSCVTNLQVVIDPNKLDNETLVSITTGAAIHVSGKLVASEGSKQSIEVHANQVFVLGRADTKDYPIQPKKHTLEFLREKAHLRPRTSTFGAIYRISHELSFAVHQFFHEHGFLNVHTPIITGSDAEGAGEMFHVSILDPKNPPKDAAGNVDYSQDFFGQETGLTVSGQLEGELAALALGNIYTFGPTFRAENSNTTRHLAEFWMIEPEMAFVELEGNMDVAESLLKTVIAQVMEACLDDLAFLEKRLLDEEKNKPAVERSPMPLLEKLKFVLENDFERVTYSQAIDILKNSKPNKKKKFKYPVNEWGVDLQSEHERFLVEKHFKKPVILFDYPANIKAFYMRENEDKKTVAAMDILFPGIGEIVGGSQREERLTVLEEKMKTLNIPLDEMSWYLDTRRYGSVKHSGFGLGFERLVLFVCGMGNIRDVIPFPRTPGNAKF